MHELSVDDVRESFARLSEAERDFRVAETELLGRMLNRNLIATTTAVVFGNLLDYLAAGRAYHRADVLFMQQAFPGQERTGAPAMMVENLHRTIDRAFIAEEEFRLEKITFRVLLIVEGADARETTA